MKAKPIQYIEELRLVAPNLSIEVSRQTDPTFKWDGDGPNPRKSGYVPCNVTVCARFIHKGDMVTGNAYLGGSYYKPAEDTGEVHGYLIQMIEEAICELPEPVKDDYQIKRAFEVLTLASKKQYDDQMKPAKA